MKPKLFYSTILLLLLPVITGAILWPVSISQAQESLGLPEWKVYMQVGPCAGSLRDWMTVASEPPAHGSGFYQPARSPTQPINNSFERTPAGFAAAHIRADFLRILGITAAGETGQIAKYDNYCCHDWTVWRKQETDGSIRFSATRGQNTPGEGWVLERGGLCCEHAHVLAGVGGGCGDFTLSTGQVIRFTGDGFVHLGAGPVTVENIVIPPLGTTTGGFGGMEDNMNFTGSNIRFFGMNEGPESCLNACNQDSNCVAFTYVKKGAFDSNPDNAVCYLKSSVGERVSTPCCISGVKAQGGSTSGGKCPPGKIEIMGVCGEPGPSR